MMRQGKMIKSRWHMAHFVLTHGAFLHCFENWDSASQQVEAPLFSIDLKQCNVNLTSGNYLISLLSRVIHITYCEEVEKIFKGVGIKS